MNSPRKITDNPSENMLKAQKLQAFNINKTELHLVGREDEIELIARSIESTQQSYTRASVESRANRHTLHKLPLPPKITLKKESGKLIILGDWSHLKNLLSTRSILLTDNNCQPSATIF